LLAGAATGSLVAGLRLSGTSCAHDWCCAFATVTGAASCFALMFRVLTVRAKRAWFIERGLVHRPPPRAIVHRVR
jgi:hypothetical protein